MRELLNQERALSPALVRTAMTVMSLLFAGLALLVVLQGLGTLFGGALLAGLTQIIGGLAILFALYLVMRLLAEILMALHRLNDRMTILGDTVREQREEAPKSSTPPRKPAARKKPAAAKSDAED
ncbi:MAG: hypothetical protein V3V03_05085 [Hyphomonadaceae bacterium]